MKIVTTIISILTFLLACGQVKQEKTVFHQSDKDSVKEFDIASLWAKEIKNQSYLKKLDTDIALLKTLDISNIISFNDTMKNETSGHFSTYTGALGQNFERIDFHIYSASKVANQDYEIKLLMRQGKAIDTLLGNLKFIEAFEFREFFNDENMQTMVFLYDFNFTTKNPNRGLIIKGTSSVSFYVEDNIARNFWMADGSLREYIRTFVGYSIDSKTDDKRNCVFALDAAGLYSYLPFCDDLYYIDEENYSPDYYLIKEKYRQYGWQDYDYNNPNKDKWWKK